MSGSIPAKLSMKRRDMFCCLAGCIPLAAQTQSEPEVLIHEDVSRVLLDVSVSARPGEYIAGLTQKNFRIYEDGKLQEIRTFSSADSPATVGILVDDSGSMRGRRDQVLTAALLLVQESNRMDEMFVLHFNEQVFRGLPDSVLFSADPGQLRQAMFYGRAEGRTTFYDAVVAGLKQLERGSYSRKALVAVSDGGDNHSSHTLAEVEALVQESLVTIYAIGLFDEVDRDSNPGVLKRLVRVSGGLAFFPEDVAGITPACRRIAGDLRNRYSLSYAPDANDGAERIRQIRVEAFSASRGSLHVTARTSYRYRHAGTGTP